MASFETIIGLEIHLKLNSPNKLFCRCANIQDFDDLEPNTHICPLCTGQPGALPILNKEPLAKAIQLGLALGCHINKISRFDRKSYFYPDLPMGYQITQQEIPTCVDGEVSYFIDTGFTSTNTIRIRDAHIETDTGKTSQEGAYALLDYNRAGTPLVEIVTHPDFRSDDEVVAFLQELQRIATYNAISDAEMEKGQMRCDVNISLREVGEEAFRTRVEMKNMNSFSAVRRAIAHEVQRQQEIYASGEEIAQETRGWDDAQGISYVMRSKEDAMDYRYIPEPDLPPLVLEDHWIDELRVGGVQLPYERIKTYKELYGFNKEYINGLIGDVMVNTYFEQCIIDGCDPKLAATWIVGPIARYLNEETKKISDLPFSYMQFVQFLQLQADGTLITQHAKTVMKEMLETGKDPALIIEENDLKPVDAHVVKGWVEEFFAEHPNVLDDLQTGNMKPMGFVVGQVMKKSAGSADPQMIQQAIKDIIG